MSLFDIGSKDVTPASSTGNEGLIGKTAEEAQASHDAANQKEENTVPFSRFKEVNDAKKAAESEAKRANEKYMELQKQIDELKKSSNPDSKTYDPNMDYDAALKLVEERAKNAALAEIRAEQEAKSMRETQALSILSE